MKKIPTLVVSAVLVILTSLALYSFDYKGRHCALTHDDWVSQVNGQFVKVDFDADGDFEVKFPGCGIEKEGIYSASQKMIEFKEWTNMFKTESKTYKYTYSFQGSTLVLKPASKADAALFGAKSAQKIVFQQSDD